ncbi:MAG: MFS transporter [Clostridia bacterium]|jgi:MFS family permease|nr:MFS transporter [Clostridia bacterium]
MKLANNIKYFPAYEAFNNIQIMAPIYTLMLIAKGLSFAELMIVQAVYTFTCTLLDVFSGCLSDRIGRKKILIFGQILIIMSLGLWVFLDGFWPAVVLKAIYGAGMTFKNGADVSLLYESLKYMKREKEYEEVKGRADSYMYVFASVECILAGFVFGIDKNLPIAIAAILSLINLIFIVLFEETNEHEQKCRIKFLSELKVDTKYVLSNIKIIKIIVATSIYYFFIRINFIHFAPYLKDMNFKIEYIGIIYFVANLTTALATKHNNDLYMKFKGDSARVLHLILIGAGFLFVTGNVYLFIIGMLVHQSFRSVYMNIVDLEINEIVDNDKRAAIMSYKSMILNLSYSLLAPIFGFMAESRTNYDMYVIYLGLILVAFALYKMIFRDKKGKVAYNN